jgi:hypothetical protein
MKGERLKRRFWKRASWGKIRSQVRSRFSKGNYEVEPQWLSPERDSWGIEDSSRIRWKLTHRKPKWGHDMLAWHIAVLQGDTTDLEKKYGIFHHRCPGCGVKLINLNCYFVYPPTCIPCRRKLQ